MHTKVRWQLKPYSMYNVVHSLNGLMNKELIKILQTKLNLVADHILCLMVLQTNQIVACIVRKIPRCLLIPHYKQKPQNGVSQQYHSTNGKGYHWEDTDLYGFWFQQDALDRARETRVLVDFGKVKCDNGIILEIVKLIAIRIIWLICLINNNSRSIFSHFFSVFFSLNFILKQHKFKYVVIFLSFPLF